MKLSKNQINALLYIDRDVFTAKDISANMPEDKRVSSAGLGAIYSNFVRFGYLQFNGWSKLEVTRNTVKNYSFTQAGKSLLKKIKENKITVVKSKHDHG